MVKVPELAIIKGTRAHLETGDKISIKDLIIGCLLPSGNDAAITLAVYVGKLLTRNN